ncbi:hypothetical protein [Methyloradius palustris]|uniref:Uncharacterized protein n=1 Tax=Methyloradius palustris TaxID=2778876 RepID=A0A8D5G1L8_9PROT|nr:hypothetical protein [Methyloradius palustris]BCM25715.1 hypothetical protein ZMTM_19740 [Methyloradius palustris]
MLNTSDKIVTIPTESPIHSPENLATSFNNFSRKSTESVIEMAKIVVAAKKLPAADYQVFCSQIRFDSQSKALVKLNKIGSKADLFMQHAVNLPSNWTTLYILAALSDDAFTSLALQQKLSTSLTGAEAQKLVDATTDKPSSSIQNPKPPVDSPALPTSNQTVLADNRYCIAIHFENTPTSHEVLELKTFVDAYQQRAKCSVAFSKILENMLAELQLTAESVV